MKDKVLLDTSFFIRLLNDEDPLHENALGYFKYFLQWKFPLVISTISIAEYCVRGSLDELPLKNLQIIPFNINHAKKTGVFANILFNENKVSPERLYPRAIIPNDSKLFAQADIEETITYFVTSDVRSNIIYQKLAKTIELNFKLILIDKPCHEIFCFLDL